MDRILYLSFTLASRETVWTVSERRNGAASKAMLHRFSYEKLPYPAFSKEVASPFGFVISQNDWIVGKFQIITEDYSNGKINFRRNGLNISLRKRITYS